MTGIILSAAKAESTLSQVFGQLPACMLPVNGKPLLYYQLQYFKEAGFQQIIINVDYQRHLIERYANTRLPDGMHITFNQTDAACPPGNSLLDALKVVSGDSVCVLLGDTLITNLKQVIQTRGNAIVTGSIYDDSKRWCLVEVNERQEVCALYDKFEGLSNERAAAGMYLIEHPERVLQWAALQSPGSIELSAIFNWIMQHEPVYNIDATNFWLDFGHLDYYQASRKRLLESRSFNNLSFDNLLGTITKRSTRIEKFIGEIQWQLNLPKRLSVLVPRIIDYDVTSDRPYITMEYYGYPTVAELWISGGFEANIYKSILKKLFRILIEFRKEKRTVTLASYQEMYFGKTEDRLEQMMGSHCEATRLLHYDEIVINGRKYRAWQKLRHHVKAWIESLYSEADNCLIHGDFCFSNILYDINNGVVRLIDPRGSWGDAPHGDIKYDFAKLRHSVVGMYDFIVSDAFHLSVSGNVITYTLLNEPKHQDVAAYFDILLADYFDPDKIKLIEGLLFLSMIPLHDDHAKRQVVMMARALELLNHCYERFEVSTKS